MSKNQKISDKKSLTIAVSCRFLIFFSFFLPIISLNVLAGTMAQYREEIQKTKELANKLNYLDPEELSPAEYSKQEREIFTKLRQILPETEKVEWKGTSIETNNKWLQDSLIEFEKDETSSSQRTTILTGISERLSAIEQKINELENPAVSNRTKDEDKQKLNEILNREEYKKPEPKESLYERIMNKIAEWLSKTVPHPDIPQSTTSGFQAFSLILQILIYAGILGAIGFLIYRFAPYIIKRFQSRENREKKDRIILGERIAANESADNLFSEAERLAREGNLRGAIRKGYIAFLCELSDRKIIGLSQHKTNRDYLRDVKKKRELFENMNGLTLNYERHWYGFETAEEKDWEEFKNDYKQAVNIRQ